MYGTGPRSFHQEVHEEHEGRREEKEEKTNDGDLEIVLASKGAQIGFIPGDSFLLPSSFVFFVNFVVETLGTCAVHRPSTLNRTQFGGLYSMPRPRISTSACRLFPCFPTRRRCTIASYSTTRSTSAGKRDSDKGWYNRRPVRPSEDLARSILVHRMLEFIPIPI